MTVHNPLTQDRAKLHYHTAYGNHVLLFHFVNGIGTTLAGGRLTAYANAAKVLLTSAGGFDRAEFAVAGSNIFNDIAFTAIVGTGAGAAHANSSAVFMSFVGRTPQGTRARLYQYFDLQAGDLNYRYTSAEVSAVGAILTVLRDSTNPIVAIDGGTPVWKDYANLGYNKYYVNRRRRQ